MCGRLGVLNASTLAYIQFMMSLLVHDPIVKGGRPVGASVEKLKHIKCNP